MSKLRKIGDFTLDTVKVAIQTILIAGVATGFGWLMKQIISNEIVIGIAMIVAFVVMAAWGLFVMVGPPWKMEKTPWLRFIGLGKQPPSEKPTEKPPPEPIGEEERPAGVHLSDDDWEEVKVLLQTERTNARYWEYSYLRYFLQFPTVYALTWLSTQATPIAIEIWKTGVMDQVVSASNMEIIVSVLQTHSLIELVGANVRISPKGQEFLTWYRQPTASN